jgi:Ca2+:H+ antiporter
LRHKEQNFRIEGTGSGLAALVVMSTLVLVMPSLTTSAPGANYTASQLLFVAAGSLVLWLVFVFIQTVRHRDYFLPTQDAADEDVHATPPTSREALASFALLIVALVSVVGLAKLLSPTLAPRVRQWQAPTAVVGTLIAIIVLAPEPWAAIRAARASGQSACIRVTAGFIRRPQTGASGAQGSNCLRTKSTTI